MTQTSLQDLDRYRDAITREGRVLLFKHSPACPTSFTAHGEWQRFVEAHPEVPTLFVDVIAARALARGLATECGVPHASPQAILFEGGEAVWNASHWNVTAESLAAAWAGHG
jgi:bacillithiol system protein YtxJ